MVSEDKTPWFQFKAHLHIPFTHAFAALSCIFYYLPWFVDVYGKKIITLKMQCNEENACGNRMWQLSFRMFSFRLLNKKDSKFFQLAFLAFSLKPQEMLSSLNVRFALNPFLLFFHFFGLLITGRPSLSTSS